jgi:F-type H+-transporting ATPase subunit delta
MTHSAVASRYAGALVDVATGSNAGVDPHQVLNDLRSFADTLNGSPELRNALTSPSVPPARKRAVIGRIGEKLSISRISRNFLYVLSDRRRIETLAEVLEAFELLLDERLGFTRAEISSAAELNQPQRDAVTRQFEHITGRKMRTRFSVDNSLLGGLVARIGSTVYDGSVRGQLEALGKRMSAE